MRHTHHLLLCLVAVLFFAARALSADELPPDANDWTTVFPEFKNAPTPKWVKPGLQLGYFIATANVSGQRHGYQLDPDGRWKDDKGNRYSQYDTNGAGAHGYAVTTILAAEKNTVIAQMNTSLFNGNGALAPAMSAGVLANGGACDCWLSTPAIEKLLAANNDVMKVARAPFVLDKKKYDAVWVAITTDKLNSFYVFDAPSGLLLRSATCAEGAAPGIVGPGEAAGPMVTLTLTSFVGTRTLDVPWGGQKLPDAAAKLKQMSYEGSITVTVAGAGGASLPHALTVDLKRRGETWIEGLMTLPPQGGIPTAPVRTFGGTWGGGLFMPPAALANLKAGQELDKDPVTKYVTTVVGQVAMPNGGKAVVIRDKGQVHSVDSIYDLATGLMVGMERGDASTPPGYTVTRLKLTGQR